MENKKGTTVLLTVIGIATLLVAVVGATFAYFTAQVTTSDPDKHNVTVTAAQLGTINFSNSNVVDLGDTVYPGANTSNTFTVTAAEDSTVKVDYTVNLKVVENTFTTTNLEYFVCSTNGSDSELGADVATCPGSVSDITNWTAFGNGTTSPNGTTIKLGTAKLGTNGAVDTWTVYVRLKETGEAQNDDQGKKFTATLEVVAGTTYTTDSTGNIVEYTTTNPSE